MKHLILVAGFTLLVAAYAQTPVVPDNAVGNAASGATPVAPGSLVSIFGTDLAASLAQAGSIPLSTQLGNPPVSVTFNNIPAPLVFVSSGQINAQLPWSLSTGQATVVVSRGGNASRPATFQVGALSPGIFAINGQAVAYSNSDFVIAAPVGSIPGLTTRPTKAGDVLEILGTGLGPVDSPIQDARNTDGRIIRTSTVPVVLIGGRPATLLFSGLSPQFPGVNQLDIIVPDGVPTGNQVPLQIQIGDITSTDKVTIAVQ